MQHGAVWHLLISRLITSALIWEILWETFVLERDVWLLGSAFPVVLSGARASQAGVWVTSTRNQRVSDEIWFPPNWSYLVVLTT